MWGIFLFTILAALVIYLGYFYVQKLVRVQTNSTLKSAGTGKKNSRYKGKNRASTPVVRDEFLPEYEKKIGLSLLVVFMLAAFVIRIIGAVWYKGYDVDISCFLAWADMIFENGIGNFYSLDAFTDYPPGYMYILYVIGGMRAVFHIAQSSVFSIILTKLPAIICDMITGWLVYKIASKKIKERGAAVLAGVFLITPAIVMDSAIWAQVDSVFTLFIVLMCYLITKKKLIPAYFVFAIGILIKPQSLIFTPVLIYGIIDQVFIDSFRDYDRNHFWKKFFIHLGSGLSAILLIALLMLPFGFSDALKQYTETLGSYPYASVNAYNIWAMFGKNWVSQTETFLGISYQVWGSISILATVAGTTVLHFKSKDRQSKYYFEAALIVISVFTLSVRMHERYVYPAIVLLLLAYAVRPRKKIYLAYLFVSAGCFMNMAHSMLYYDPNNYDFSNPVPYLVGAFMVAFLGYMIYLAVTMYRHYESEEEESKKIDWEVAAIWQRWPNAGNEENIIGASKKMGKIVKADLIAMAVITVIYAIVAFSNLGNMQAPETPYSFVKNGEIMLDFGKEVEIQKMWDYLGYANNPKYVVSYSNDTESGWQDAFSEANPWDAGSVFCWNDTDTSIKGRYVKIKANADITEDSMMELVFQDRSGNVLLPVNSKEYQALFDEQDLFEGRATCRNGTYFDEIYHARTAYEMIHDLRNYENTHPPLGKTLIALGILIFGMNPFGWRFMGTLFGVLMLPLLYVFAKKMMKETWISILATVLFAFDFMHFAQTRIATIDVFVTFFIMLAYFFMYCYSQKSFYDTKLKDTFIPLGLCGIAMGLSWASKWTGIYASAGLCVIFFLQMIQRFREYMYAAKTQNQTTDGIVHKDILETFYPKFFKTIGFCCIFFLAIPAVIYTLSYIPMNDGTNHGLVQRMLDNQTSMYNYHSNLDATHPYSSEWYEWPVMVRPIWYYSGTLANGLKEGISAFGNPLVWWVGIPAFLMILYLAVMFRNKKASFLTLGYLSQYLPWVLIGRVVFIYHYFPSVPFVVLMIAYCMKKIADWKPKWKKAMFVYVGLAVVLFIMFYPVLTGIPVDPGYVSKYLKWFDGWVLI
ncbi:MAG: glycosyltransferase family 39 protein [Butyribacter sp.]|nr:glycosyltransferase family 39 protein [bacterium]MDY3854943.1 glycosyltransferase family 39 protein [Butyribacter sp.]